MKVNLYGDSQSQVRWRSYLSAWVLVLFFDGDLVGLVRFVWRTACCFFHGDPLVMDGFAQDELLHQTDPGSESQRTNLAFSWIKQHAHGGPLATVVAYCLPSCAHGLSVQQTPEGHAEGLLWVFLTTCCVLLTLGVLWPLRPALYEMVDTIAVKMITDISVADLIFRIN